MKRSLASLLFLLLAACVSTTPTSAPPAAPATASAPRAAVAPVHVVVVGTTDVHGWFNGHAEVGKASTPGVHYGGLALFSAYVNALRAANPGHVLIVDSGDMFQGTLESNIFEGEPVVRGYNAIGYAAAAVGNHEFDYGPVGPDPVAREAGEDSLGALKRNAKLAAYPLLSANMTEKATGQTPSWAKRSILVNVGGAKIGIIGLSTPDTPNVTMMANVASLNFGDPAQATIREAADLRAHGADAVIVIAHMGGRCGDMKDIHDVASCESEQEAMHLLTAIPKGTIDAYFAGHTHAQMRQVIEGVPVFQALAYSREFSTLDLWIDPANHRVDHNEMRPHTMICPEVYEGSDQCDPKQAKAGAKLMPRVFEGQTIVPDAKVAAIVEPYLQKVAAKRSERVGVKVAAPFTRAYQKESTLGNLITDLLREAESSDIAFMNSGGIRADLRAGDTVYSDVFEVSPFDNYPAVVTLTGAQIADALRLTTTGERGILQVSGLRYTYDASKQETTTNANDRNRVMAVTLGDGSPLIADKLYRVTMPDFLAAGGDGLMPMIKKVPKDRIDVQLAKPIRDMLVDQLRKRGGELTPKLEGRITVIGGEKAQ